MTATARRAEKPAHQRAQGRAAVSFSKADKGVRLRDLAQSGAAKVMLPRVHNAAPEIVFLNTAGGLTGGDRLSYAVDLGPDATATATTQTAERAYASLPDAEPARLSVNLRVGARGHLNWVPQETILFENAALDRQTCIDLAEGASCLSCETIILGRAAMGEMLSAVRLRDRREITRAGTPVFLEPLALSDADLARRSNAAVLGEALAFASVVLVSDDAETRLDPLRRLLDTASAGVEVAASAWAGRLVVRAMAKDGRLLRGVLSRVLRQLGCDLPRVWQM